MDKLNIVIAIPTPMILYPEFALDSLPALISDAKGNDNIENVYLLWQSGVRTDRNRNIMLKRMYEQEIDFDYVLWLDTDMVYPDDMITKYAAQDPFHVIGCMYFKKSPPFAPVGYIEGDNPTKPFKPLNPKSIKPNEIYEVHGLGFGGMMVSKAVYDELGDNKWMSYGKKFHLPYDTDNHLTHDLEFCNTVREAGFTLLLHGGVKPGHIGTGVVTQRNYLEHLDRQKAMKTDDGKIYSSNWIEKHEKVWEEHLKPIDTVRTLLEIGCYEGRATNWFIENLKPRKVTVIDTFDGSGYLANKNPEEVFRHNTQEYSDMITVKKGRSQEILPDMQGKFDFIYVDGAHGYEDVKIDAKESWRLLNPGGYILFDDYEWYRWGKENAPKPAIDEFIENTDNIDVIHKGEQVLVRKPKEGDNE